ncbi:MAG TPA: DUF3843 family protein [Bacteroidales bacterium]|nr:DUF3843 family protein [Bacteroidales bacterium]
MKTNTSISQAWMNHHPSLKQTNIDHYYIGLCIRVRDILKGKEFRILFDNFDHIDRAELAAFLVCYFEDVISDLGLWRAFRNEHQRLYGKHLPFYNITDDYYEDEINFADVAFLIWYYLTCKQDPETSEDSRCLLNPETPAILLMTEMVFEIFEEQYEFAVENTALREFIQIPGDVDDFYDVRYRIQWLLTNSYLFHFMSDLLILRSKSTLDKYKDWPPEQTVSLLNELKDGITLSENTHLLAYKGHEWYAEILGRQHPLYKPLKAIGRKRSGNLVYTGKSDKYIHFEHPPTGRRIDITRRSLEDMDPHILPGTVVTIGFVKWMEEWWFSGMMAIWGKSKDFFEKDNSIESASLFSDENEDWKQTTDEQFELFLKYNHGRPVAFFDSFFEANNFIREFMLQWNFEMRKKLNQQGDEKVPPFLPREVPPSIRERSQDDCLVFFNKDAGIEFLTHMCPVIPDEQNKLYKGSIDPALPMHLVMANECSCGFVHFSLDQYGFRKYLLFPGEKNARLVPDNLDFLLRLYKRYGYFPEPQVHMVDSKRFR